MPEYRVWFVEKHEFYVDVIASDEEHAMELADAKDFDDINPVDSWDREVVEAELL